MLIWEAVNLFDRKFSCFCLLLPTLTNSSVQFVLASPGGAVSSNGRFQTDWETNWASLTPTDAEKAQHIDVTSSVIGTQKKDKQHMVCELWFIFSWCMYLRHGGLRRNAAKMGKTIFVYQQCRAIMQMSKCCSCAGKFMQIHDTKSPRGNMSDCTRWITKGVLYFSTCWVSPSV